MNGFKEYHPTVNFIYFILVIVYSCVFMHPVSITVSLFGAISYLMLLKGFKEIKNTLFYILGVVCITGIINPLFNHEGATIITYFKNGNPLTLQSIVYGFLSGGMLSSVIIWFMCYSEVFTSDKFIYLFGKIIPSLSLVFSMTLSMVPKFFKQLKKVINLRKCMGKDLGKVKNALLVLSSVTTWALENSLDTLNSMRARGYSLPKRTSFSIYKFTKRDMLSLVIILSLGVFILVFGITGEIYFNCFPTFKMSDSLTSQAVLTLFYILPLTIETREVLRWKALKSKI